MLDALIELITLLAVWKRFWHVRF